MRQCANQIGFRGFSDSLVDLRTGMRSSCSACCATRGSRHRARRSSPCLRFSGSLERLPAAVLDDLDTSQCAIGGLMMMLVGACASYKFGRRLRIHKCRAVQWEVAPGDCPGFKDGASASC